MSCVLLRHTPGQRAVRHRLPSLGGRKSGGALGQTWRSHDADHAAGRATCSPASPAIGVAADDIDVVVCSHLHPDHCGCNAFFKRATFVIHEKEIAAARAPEAEMSGYLAHEWDLPVRSTLSSGERDVFGDGRIVLIPLPGHTPGTTGALVALENSGMFLLAADTVSLRATLDTRHRPAQHLERRRAEEIARRSRPHRGERRDRCSAATTPRNGTRCARAPTPMTDGAEIHARPKIIGARIKRTEDPRLLTGPGAFTDDRQVPRVLHVAFRRSEHAHARIMAIDCAAAREAAGVVAVLTAEDLAATVAPLFATSRMKGYYATPILPLARGKVRYVGEPVVGIVAQSRYLAEDALELIDIEFEPLPAVIDPLEAAKTTRRGCTRRPAPT